MEKGVGGKKSNKDKMKKRDEADKAADDDDYDCF